MEDLSLFTNTDFFDYDVFAKDANETGKAAISSNNNSNFEEFIQSVTNFDSESFFPLNESSSPEMSVDEFNNIKQEEVVTPSMLQIPLSYNDKSYSEAPEAVEDKKRRNTLASARFRVKKKQKKQEMESQIANLRQNITNYNQQIKKLEIENRLLKNLIQEKSSITSSVLKSSDRLIPDFSKSGSSVFKYTV